MRTNADGHPVLRVATLNLLAHPYALRERVDRLVAELRGEDVDILLLQEVLRRKQAKFNVPAVLADALGMPHYADHHISGRSSGNVTLSRTPLHRLRFDVGDRRMLATGTIVNGRRVVVINNHGAWGSFAGAARLEEAFLADRIARAGFDAYSPNPEKGYRPHRDERPIVIYGGDLNTGPDSTPIRYLTGRDVVNGQSTFWMDAWDAAPAGAAGHTIHPTVWSEIEYGDRTDTPYLPGRHPRERFDYLLVHEWSYGHAGDPLRARRFGEGAFRHDGHDLTISDHLGVIADLYLPEGTLLAAGGA